MDLYEYQGKELFKRFDIPVSEGGLATSPEEARAAAETLGGQVVVKAQVLTGGRGKRSRTCADLDAYPIEERAAREKGVTYVELDSEVGILGNGAGLVMSTLDVIAHVGGRPANFCDLGGGGDAQGFVDALEVITGDAQVESIFFNIFGGITRCDEVARGILEALGRMAIEDPIVVRLDGTNADEGRRLPTEAAPSNLYVEETMLSAAERAVEVAR